MVAKSHLDLGFTALAAEVEARYLRAFFPSAIATAAELRRRGGPQLVWTTGSWILSRALADPAGGAAVAAAVEAGDLAWHAWPVTTHTELLDRRLAEAALGWSARLDERFWRRTTAAKMTDVPGHTIGLVPVLAGGGVGFLHLGVNPAWPVPEVPPVFRWVAPDGSSVVVAYQAGGYGGEVVVPGCEHALAFLHAGDNAGPPSAGEVEDAHGALADRYPGAQVVGSTLDAFGRALAASDAVGELPEVRDEIGDAWLFGTGADPQKLAGYRRALRARSALGDRLAPDAAAEVDEALLLVAEHTWGLDQKEALPDEANWSPDAFARLRATPAGRRFEASWAEQRGYLDRAWGHLEAAGAVRADPAADGSVPALGQDPVELGYASVAADEPIPLAGWTVAVDAATGALVHLVAPRGRVLADADHPLGRLAHQTFDAASYEAFYAQLVPIPADEAWARADNTKPGLAATDAVAALVPASLEGCWVRQDGTAAELLVGVGWGPGGAGAAGAPSSAWIRWRWHEQAPDRVEVVVAWRAKAATRFPEATWCTFAPRVADPGGWRLDKLGVAVDPTRVVRHGGRALHAAGEGCRYDGPDGPLALDLLDAPLVAPGRPGLLDADPPVPDLAGGWHVLLHDNCWGTNVPMWSEGPASFAFALRIG